MKTGLNAQKVGRISSDSGAVCGVVPNGYPGQHLESAGKSGWVAADPNRFAENGWKTKTCGDDPLKL